MTGRRHRMVGGAHLRDRRGMPAATSLPVDLLPVDPIPAPEVHPREVVAVLLRREPAPWRRPRARQTVAIAG